MWLRSLNKPDWQSKGVDGVDFSTMLLGTAAHDLGMEFF